MTNETKKMFADAINAGEIVFWEDPRHGWLQVPLKLVEALKKEKDLEVSVFSYQDKRYAYLEEDCDLTAFCNCFPWINFREVFSGYSQGFHIDRKYQEHIFIRSLNHVA